MQCKECGKHLRLAHKRIEIDTLWKEYQCRNGHITIYRRYGHTVEINGERTQVDELFDFAEANRQAANKQRNRTLLQKITSN